MRKSLMRTSRLVAAGLLVAVGLALSSASATAQGGLLRFGAKAGLVGPGCVYVEDSDCFDSDINYSVGGFLDYMLAERLSGGLFLDLHGISSELNDTEMMLDVGITLKAVITPRDSRLTIRPGFGLGYGTVTVLDEKTTFLTMRVPLEVTVALGSGRSAGGEVGLFFGPTGGNESVDVTFGPGFLLRAVITF